ncbi:interleukin-27 receptor subunit alpha isoform X2 [Marmota marmota marmota]|uniref:interleukin-27 receptor subunit alpha isoform X2 n=1 Tax=Marmota marmota marmota TaxID=9994 RepID=UPI0020925BEE|nr:interleukin-27 receptor subunit alpha isoform X2 [Marmota marmota marmota]
MWLIERRRRRFAQSPGRGAQRPHLHPLLLATPERPLAVVRSPGKSSLRDVQATGLFDPLPRDPLPPSPGGPGPLQCHGVEPLGNLNCSWEPLGDLGAPSMLHLQSQKYHSNRTRTVAVPSGQSWVTVPREKFTVSDTLLVWGTKAGQVLWPPVLINLETRMKPRAPRLRPEVDFSEDEPLEATVQWEPPTWPPHKVLICQFYYRRCPEVAWTLLEPELKTAPLTPIEIPDLELATRYEVSGRCRVDTEAELWGESSPVLSFQTLPSAPKDVWVSGNRCRPPSGQELLLLWKAPGPCVQVSYRVWFWVGEKSLTQEGVPCCKCSVPPWAEWAGVSAVNTSSWEPRTNFSLVCLAPDSAPHDVVVSGIPGSTQLLVTWQPGDGEPLEHVVDWAQDGDTLEDLNWVRLPPGNLSALLPGTFKGGVPYRITVTAVFPGGLAPASSVWAFREERAPLAGPTLWRLQDDPPGTPTVAWEEVPRHQLQGHLTHYTLCSRSGTNPSDCTNVSSSTRIATLPNLHWGPCELWVTASTIAGQGPPGPSLWLHLPDNTVPWRVLPGVLALWGLLLVGCGLSLVMARRCLHLRQKVLPHWVWEKVPDPANSSAGQTHVEVEEMEPPAPKEPPQSPAPLHSGYEKHFLPTPEELGLLRPPKFQDLV